jgi:hypothetical protein
MTESGGAMRQPGPRGCLGTAAGLAVLALISPFALVVHRWRCWRRGKDIRVAVASTPRPASRDGERRRIDAVLDVPLTREQGFRRRVTDAVVRVAEDLRRPDDIYTMIYRSPADEEAVALAVGPQIQALGERFSLTLNQGPVEGRTVVWLTLGRGTALAEVVDRFTCDPEGVGEPEGLLSRAEARWAMASEWARVGPSLIIRLVLVVPSTASETVRDRLRTLGSDGNL